MNSSVKTKFETINPTTGQILTSYECASGADIEAALSMAENAHRAWAKSSFQERSYLLNRMADALCAEQEVMAQLAAREMGKPVRDGRAEVIKCAALCRYYAAEMLNILSARHSEVENGSVRIVYEPMGIIFSVTPWNFPFWQVLRAAIPALVAGNVVLNKPAPNVIGCAAHIIALAEQVGFPRGVLQSINTDNRQSANIIKDDRIKGVALTGSEKAGAAVAKTAGGALKKSVLELGGSDPFIVLEDANIPAAAKAAARSRFTNAGQVCVASKRFIIDAKVIDDFIDAFLIETGKFLPADPLLDETIMGPMARDDLREQLSNQAMRTLSMGADIILPGGPIDGDGFFYAPTILRNPHPDSPVLTEETFGPLAAIVESQDEIETVKLANSTRFGLSSSIWTADEQRALNMAQHILSGGVFINMTTVSDPRFPFGGIGRSGYGRELGTEGVHEFCNLKTIRLQRS